MNVEEYNAQIAAGMSEAKLQDLIVKLAQTLRWLPFHVYDSRKSIGAGFPDLVLAREDRLILAELKTMTGRQSPRQKKWEAALYHGPAEFYLWRPSHFVSREVEFVLR